MEHEIKKQEYSVNKMKRAKQHLKRVKAWYWLIPINLIATATLGALSWLMYSNGEPNTIIWILMSCAMGLWVIFIIEGIVLKKSKAVRSWEKRQLKRYMKQDIEMPKYE